MGIFHEFIHRVYLSISWITWKMALSSKLPIKKNTVHNRITFSIFITNKTDRQMGNMNYRNNWHYLKILIRSFLKLCNVVWLQHKPITYGLQAVVGFLLDECLSKYYFKKLASLPIYSYLLEGKYWCPEYLLECSTHNVDSFLLPVLWGEPILLHNTQGEANLFQTQESSVLHQPLLCAKDMKGLVYVHF